MAGEWGDYVDPVEQVVAELEAEESRKERWGRIEPRELTRQIFEDPLFQPTFDWESTSRRRSDAMDAIRLSIGRRYPEATDVHSLNEMLNGVYRFSETHILKDAFASAVLDDEVKS